MLPINQIAHEFLIENGYSYKYVPAEWEDCGSPESGPDVVGHPGYDEYELDDEVIVIDAFGSAWNSTKWDGFDDIILSEHCR